MNSIGKQRKQANTMTLSIKKLTDTMKSKPIRSMKPGQTREGIHIHSHRRKQELCC